MQEIPIWEVTLFVYGSITVKQPFRLSEFKGFTQKKTPFYSDIEIRRNRADSGIKATVTAFATTENFAREAAILFFGQMLDALAIKINQPLYLNFSDHQSSSRKNHDTLRRVREDEWKSAFKEAQFLATKETTFLRALGWYRKGLYTEDPFDKFLAFWNSIEIVTSKYYRLVSENKIEGSKDQIKVCFNALWGECENWSIIKGETNWIKDNYEIRKTIAHGTQAVTIETLKKVTERIGTIEQVANTFLLEWREEMMFLFGWPSSTLLIQHD